MIGDQSRWLVTVLFAVAAGWHLHGLVRELVARSSAGPRPMVGAGLQTLMCAAMIAMCWTRDSQLFPVVLAGVFSAAAWWFAATVALPEQCETRRDPWTTPLEGCYQVAMMAVMVWMGYSAARMSPATHPVRSGPLTSGMASMGGMATASSSDWVGKVCLALAVGFGGAALGYVTVVVRTFAKRGRQAQVRRSGALHAGVGVLMAAGMGVALLNMA